jgi:predicted ATP-dependent serine protease
MANGVLIVGPAGSGKSTAIRNLDPKTTFIIAPDKKSLPIKGWRNSYQTVRKDNKVDLMASNYLELDDPQQIVKVLEYISANRPDVVTIVLDTISHIMTSEFIKKAKNPGFQKYTDLAVDIYNICKTISTIRSDITVFVTGHTEVSFDADGGKVTKLRTIGKMLDEKVTIESLFTIVLFTSVDLKDKANPYGFETQTNGYNTAKSPMGMFEESRIVNDYNYVLDKIKQYEN